LLATEAEMVEEKVVDIREEMVDGRRPDRSA
jgi:hypothetical protein